MKTRNLYVALALTTALAAACQPARQSNKPWPVTESSFGTRFFIQAQNPQATEGDSIGYHFERKFRGDDGWVSPVVVMVKDVSELSPRRPYQVSLTIKGSEGTRGLKAGYGLNTLIEFNLASLKPGQGETCSFAKPHAEQSDSECLMELAPAILADSSRDRLNSELPLRFHGEMPRLECLFALGPQSEELAMASTGPRGSMKISGLLPTGPANSDNALKKFSFVFQCEDLETRETVLKGAYSQNGADSEILD